MKKNMTILLIVFAMMLAGCQSNPEATPTPLVPRSKTAIISVTGELVPATWASLSPKAGGIIVEVLVEPGDLVERGSELVKLDTVDLKLALALAQQQVAAQQAVLDALKNGASDLTIARADRETAFQLEQAQLNLAIKETQLEQARLNDPGSNVALARAQIAQIEAQIVQWQAQSPTAQVEAAQIELERAQIALEDTQIEYKKALDRPWEDQSIRDAWAKQLKQAQLNRRATQAQLDAAKNAQQAHTLGKAVLDTQLEAARAGLAQAVDAQAAYSLTLTMLAQEIDTVKLNIAHLEGWTNPYRDPPSVDEVAQLEALLQQARLQVAQIEQQIADATLVAPFGGTVGAVYAHAGEMAAPGQPLIVVGDLRTLRVETTDLDEIDVAQVQLDQQVTVTFDAFPDRVFQARVTRIAPMARPGSGGVNYTVVVELEELNPALKWGMTAFVDIDVK